MRRVPPSVLVREELARLLGGGVDREGNIVSALVDVVTRLVVQELLEGEQADALGGRGRYERRGGVRGGLRNGYEPGRIRTAEGTIDVQVPTTLTVAIAVRPRRSPVRVGRAAQQEQAGVVARCADLTADVVRSSERTAPQVQAPLGYRLNQVGTATGYRVLRTSRVTWSVSRSSV